MTNHCDKHGDYEAVPLDLFGKKIARPENSSKDDKIDTLYSMCPLCEAEQADTEQAELKAREHARLEKLLKDMGVPKKFKYSTLDNYNTDTEGKKKALQLCRHYVSLFDAKMFCDPIFLVGSHGTGKTHLSIGIMKRLVSTEKVENAYYTTTMRMIRDIRSSYHPKSDRQEQDIIDWYVNKDLLILDEIGVQNGTDNEKILIYEVLNGRYEELRPTVLISNYNIAGIKEYLSERVFDRLQGKNKLLAVFDWDSERGKA